MAALGIQDFWLFIAAGLLLTITPGPDTAYIVGRSLQYGWRGGMAAALGISTGCLVHVAGTVLGLSALLAASATAFGLLKLAGAAYLLVTGLRMLLSRGGGAENPQARPATSLARVFRQGALTNILNPKVALFFIAFLPQFVSLGAPNQPLAFLLLGLTFVALATVWCLGVAAFTALAARRLLGAPRLQVWTNRALGGAFIYLGLRMAMLEQR
jgi:threonine/homoserine/homoserine lactone efflux protein